MLWIESKMVKGASFRVPCLCVIRNLRWFSEKKKEDIDISMRVGDLMIGDENIGSLIMDVINWHQMVIVGIDENLTME